MYAHFKDAVQDKVADAMQNVQGLTGQWSVDVLMDEREKSWLCLLYTSCDAECFEYHGKQIWNGF